MKYKLVVFSFRAFFQKNLHFWDCEHFIIPFTDPINPMFSVLVWNYNNQVFDEVFSLLATFAMITEKLLFSYFHSNHC